MKRIMSLLFATVLLFSLSSCSLVLFNAYQVQETEQKADDSGFADNTVYVDVEKSSFSDAQRIGDEVVYICQIAVCNETDSEQSVNFVADFEQEYDMGMITRMYLYGETEAGGEVFFVPANSLEYYTVCFRGQIREDYAGDALKVDRSLPPVEIEHVDIEE